MLIECHHIDGTPRAKEDRAVFYLYVFKAWEGTRQSAKYGKQLESIFAAMAEEDDRIIKAAPDGYARYWESGQMTEVLKRIAKEKTGDL